MLLFDICHRAGKSDWGLLTGKASSYKGFLESLALWVAHLSSFVSNEVNLPLRDIHKLSDEGLHQTGFSGLDFSDDDHELSLLDVEVDVLKVSDLVKGARGVGELVLDVSLNFE